MPPHRSATPRAMDYNKDKVDEMVLALLFLTTFEEGQDGARA